MSAEHPSGYRLEALSVGAEDPEAAAHVAACAECAAYLDTLARDHALHLAAPLPDFLAAPPNVVPFERPGQVHEAAPSTGTPPDRKRRFVLLAALAAGLFAVVLLRPSVGPPLPDPGGTEPPGLRAKGGAPTVFAIRLRDGVQVRANGQVRVAPGDRLRFELTLAAPMSVAVAFWPDAGPPALLQPARALGAGTHVLDLTLQTDADPTRGWLYFGPDTSVGTTARPLVGGEIAGLRVDPEASP